jgi:hypothetical protein
MATKTWVGAHQDSPGFEAAINACDPKPDRPAKNSAPEELVACLRAHGLNPPSSIDELKPYMLQQDGTTAGRAALSACGIDSRPVEKARGKGDCGGDRPRAKASRAKAVPEQ